MATGTIAANIYLNFNRNGSWNFTRGAGNGFVAYGMTGTNYYDLSTQKGGYWANGSNATIGDGYEVSFTISDVTSGITETTSGSLHTKRIRSAAYNYTGPGAGWLSLSSNRQIALNASDIETAYGSYSMASNVTLECIARLQVVANIRKVGGTPITGNGTLFPMEVALRWSLITAPPPGGGGGCVHEDSWLATNLRASDAIVGDWLHGMILHNGNEFRFDRLQIASIRTPDLQRCIRIHMSTGATLIVSDNTPITLKDASEIQSSELRQGMELPVMYEEGPHAGAPFWDVVSGVEDMGYMPVRVISVGHQCYGAGEKPGQYVYTHNAGENSNEKL